MDWLNVRRVAPRATLGMLLSVVFLVGERAWAQGRESTVSGQVLDARTREPLSAVQVQAAGRSVQTDAEGRFVLPGVPDTAVVRFERIGYRPLEVTALSIDGRIELSPVPVLLDEIPVRAERSNALAAGTALTVASYGRTELLAGARTSVADALVGAEGVAVARVGSWGSRLFLRGLGGDRVAVMIDGMRVNPACAFGMDQGIATVDPAIVERVEILTGPGSTLYGSGNIGGVINIVTRKPVGERGLSGEVRAGASSGVPGATLGATLGLRQGTFDATLALDGARYGDYRTPHGKVHGSSFRHATADLTLGWSPDEARRLTFRSQAYEGRDIGWPAMHGMSIPSESRRSFSLDYGVQLGRGWLDAFAARAYVQRLDHEMLMEMTMDGAVPMTMESGQRSHSTTSGGRVQLRLVPVPSSHVDVGVEVTEWAAENSRWTEHSGPMHGERIEFRTWPGVSIVDAGLFGQGELGIGGGLTATLGARLDRVIRRAEEGESGREWVGSGNAGLRLALPHGFGARLSLGYGYRIPNPTELYGLALKPDGFVYRGHPGLKTETNRNIELSLSHDRPGASASVTVFRNDVRDLISPVLAPGDTIAGKPVRTYGNLARSRLVGGTGSFQIRVLSPATFSGAVSYTRGEDVTTGQPLVGIPPLEGRLAARLGSGSSFWLEVEGVAAARQDRIAADAGEVETPGYAAANVRAGFRLAGTDAILGVDNVFDRAHRGHLDPVGLLRPGRSFYAKLSRRFGFESAERGHDH